MDARVAAVVLALVVVASPAFADIYRWVDEQGRVHLDDDISRVPEAQRSGARVFHSKAASTEAPPVDPSAPTQGSFASAIARDLGLRSNESQDTVSILQIAGIYPANGWDPAASLSPNVVAEVVNATLAAARGRRLRQSPAAAEAAVLRIAGTLGVAGPPPTVKAEPEVPPIVVAPNIVVEAPAQPPVIVREVEAAPGYALAAPLYDPFLAFGIPFAPIVRPPLANGFIPERITPLSDPAGHLRGPLVPPLRMGQFQRPSSGL